MLHVRTGLLWKCCSPKKKPNRFAQRESDNECKCETDNSVCERQAKIIERGCNGASESEVTRKRRRVKQQGETVCERVECETLHNFAGCPGGI